MISRLLLNFLLPFFLFGCAHQRQFTRLSEQELTRSKQVALEEAGSPEAWERLKGKRLNKEKEPFKFDTSRVEYVIDFDQADRITVIIPSGGRLGWHSCYVAVTVALRNFEVLKMEESFWP